MFKLYFKSFIYNKKDFFKYLIIYFVILLLLMITLFVKNFNKNKLDTILNLEDNRIILISSSKQYKFKDINKILFDLDSFDYYIYSSRCEIGNYIISNYYDSKIEYYFDNDKVIYGNLDCGNINFNDVKIINTNNLSNDNILFCNNAMIKDLIENNYCKEWTIKAYLKSYRNAEDILNKLKEKYIVANYNPSNSLEITSLLKLEKLTNYCIFFEIMMSIIIILLIVVELIIDQKKYIILFKSLGYSNFKICNLFLKQLMIIILLSYITLLLIYGSVIIMLHNYWKIIFYKVDYIIKPFFIVSIISIIVYMLYFFKIKNVLIKNLK